MKKLFRFLLVLTIGAILGYVFHNPIDTKLKGWFGNENVETAKEKIEKGGETVVEYADAIKDTVEAKREENQTE
jgi:hypothetical protein